MMRDFALLLALVAASGTSARILTPTDGTEYIDALTTTNRFCPVRCAAKILEPESTLELADWMRSERSKHDHITVKGGGHSYGCQSVPKDGGMMIHTGLLKKAEVVHRKDGTVYARLGAGNTFQDVMPQLNSMGFSMPHGECITVGLGGWLLNNGGHPETLNYARFYEETPFLSKMTAVDYDGNVFSIDKNGLKLIELNPATTLEAWEKKKDDTKLWGDKLEDAMKESGAPMSPAASSSLRVMQTWGASLMIATEFEIELLKRREPEYIAITYPLRLIHRDNTLLSQISDFIASLNEDELSCGLVFMTEALPSLNDGLMVKCVDWLGKGAVNIANEMPKGYAHPRVVPYGAFFAWNKDSYGMGWTPQFFFEPITSFDAEGGLEKWRQVMLEMGKPDSPCRSCMTELNRIPENNLYTFDMMCGAPREMQDECSKETFKWQEEIVGKRTKFYKQNLPSCRANPNWQASMLEYMGAYPIAENLKAVWDSEKVVDFWLSIGHEKSDQACEATHIQSVGETCKKHGIRAQNLVQSLKRDAKEMCPNFYDFTSTTAQNMRCPQRWANRAKSLPIIKE